MPHLCSDAINLQQFMNRAHPDCGANILFTGTVRNVNEGRAVHGMCYTAHEILAEKTLADICHEAASQFAIKDCQILHRLGELVLGDVSVAILVSSPHRDAAYEASRWAIESLKKRVPIWKQERYVDGDNAYLDGQTLEQAL